MTPVERLQAAIVRLESLREEAPPGPWEHWPSQSSRRLYSGLDLDHPISAEEVLRADSKYSTQLIEVLHRTIDAQLTILRHELARAEAKIAGGGVERAVWSNARDTLALADAILGSDR